MELILQKLELLFCYEILVQDFATVNYLDVYSQWEIWYLILPSAPFSGAHWNRSHRTT